MEVQDQVTFVCCIEYGRLEAQTLLMLRTLRANGGRFADCRVIAVVSRFGPSLSSYTVEQLGILGAELYYAKQKNNWSWFHYYNKAIAVEVAQALCVTPTIAWLDSDLLFVSEPVGLLLQDNEDFTATLEYGSPAIVENDTAHIPYWQALCALLDVDFNSIPTIKNVVNKGKVQKSYLSSGVFVWRTESQFANTYVDAFQKLLTSRLASHTGDFFTADQLILSPIVAKLGFSFRHLDYKNHHVTISGQISGVSASPNMSHSNLLHYSASLTPPYRESYVRRLENECQPVMTFIRNENKEQVQHGIFSKVVFWFLSKYRGLRWKLYRARLNIAAKG